MAAPKLRFKEFDGDWKESRLKDLALKITDGTHDTPVVQKEGIPFLTAINVKDGFINYDDIGYVDEITHKKIYERCNPEKDDLLIVNIGAGTATCARNIVDYQFSLKNVALVKPNRNLLNPIFLEQIQRKNSSRLFNSLTSGGAQPFLSLKEIGKLLIKYPSLEEQTKITSFLSAVDEKISQLTQKHQLLSQYKQGMMQKLFSQKIRFKADDGSEFGEWEEKPLNHYLYTSKLKNKDLKFSKQEVLSVSGELGVVNQIELLGRSYAGVSVAPYSVVEHADIVYTKSPLKSNPYGIIKVNKGKAGIVSTLYAVYKCKDNIYPELIDYYFQSDLKLNHFLKPLVKKGAKNDMKVNNDHVLTGIVSFPSSLEEQTKIAYFLSAIDQKIEVVAQQIEQAKQWKKGLLQQMFV
ncbi:restriction endonuclease subunit S [Acinetobacter schindleri]|uniref:restriction endonuclease subunit S n=1 Tax=Acinetobacter schindleri TaxID=108981 RepID=UPI0013B08C9E|nr:restriction endonuclease subunit S [Acinetobacter schindleri]QIC64877.1 restriction endonuclease subunit S [Acinetobacter schindleri]